MRQAGIDGSSLYRSVSRSHRSQSIPSIKIEAYARFTQRRRGLFLCI